MLRQYASGTVVGTIIKLLRVWMNKQAMYQKEYTYNTQAKHLKNVERATGIEPAL